MGSLSTPSFPEDAFKEWMGQANLAAEFLDNGVLTYDIFDNKEGIINYLKEKYGLASD